MIARSGSTAPDTKKEAKSGGLYLKNKTEETVNRSRHKKLFKLIASAGDG